MSKAIETGVKCIEFHNAIDEMLAASDPAAIVRAHEKAIKIAMEMSEVAMSSDSCTDMVADALVRGALRVELAAEKMAAKLPAVLRWQ